MLKTYRKVWKQFVKNNDPTATDMIHLCLLKAYFAESNTDKKTIAMNILDGAFTPIRNESKLANGYSPYQSLRGEIAYIVPKKPEFYSEKFFWLPKSDADKYEAVFESPEQEADYLLFAKEVSELLRKSDINEETLAGATQYTYFFIRNDLSPEQQLVQMAHSSFVLGSKVPKDKIDDTHFVFLAAEDELHLEGIEEDLQVENLNFEVFIEPDLDHEMTVIGVHPNPKSRFRRFRDLKKFEFKPLKKSA